MQMGASALMIGPRRPEASGAWCEESDARDRGREPGGLELAYRSYTKLDQRALSHRRSHTDRPVEHRSTHARPASTPSRRAAKGCEKAEP